MSEFFNSISQVKQNWQSYEKWDKEQDNKEARRKELHKTRPVSQKELKEAQKRGKTIINAINVMDEYSENKAEDMEQATQAVGQIPVQIGVSAGMGFGFLLMSKIKNPKAKLLLNPWSLGFLGAALTYVPFSIWSTKVQVWASKVARFQAREKELKDPKNFVIYDDNQLKEAEKIAKTLPDEKDRDLLKKLPMADMLATVNSVNKDKKAYESWHENYLKENTRTKATYSNGIPTDKSNNTKRDQQVIINTVKKINQSAEEYSENVESVTNTMGVPISMASGAVVGFATNAVLNMLKKGKMIKEGGFVNKQSKGIAFIAGILTDLAIQSWFTSMQKTGSKVGRFKAKQEMLADPQNFVYCDDKELNSVKVTETSKKKKFFLADSWQTLMDVIKDKKEYDNYQKTQGKQDKKFRKALKLVNLKDGQLEEAKNLQEKTFNTFEKMDEMSQQYSENVEAVTDIATQTIPFAAVFGATVAALGAWVLGEKYVKNKSPEQIAAPIINFLGKFKNNKFAQNLIKDIGDALKTATDNYLIDMTQEVVNSKSTKNIGEKAKSIYKKNILKELLLKPRVRNTAIVATIPLFAGFIGSIFAVQSYFTKLQLKAGKIGVMKAMQELEDPRYFVDKYDTIKKQPAEKTAQSNPQANTQNAVVKSWLDKIEQQRAAGTT